MRRITFIILFLIFSFTLGWAKGMDVLQAALRRAAQRAIPAVVNISTLRVYRTPEGLPPSPLWQDPFFREFFGEDFFRFFGIPRERVERSLGSGVIVSEDGYILTNHHVIANASRIVVGLSDRREFEAKVVGTDPTTDIALLKIDARRLPFLPFGDSEKTQVGDIVLAIGNPFGIGQTVTMGIVSAKGRSNMGLVDYEDFIQTDAAINPGNSGGALINLEGELIGINTAIVSRTGGYQGIGFAVPSNLARRGAAEEVRKGHQGMVGGERAAGDPPTGLSPGREGAPGSTGAGGGSRLSSGRRGVEEGRCDRPLRREGDTRRLGAEESHRPHSGGEEGEAFRPPAGDREGPLRHHKEAAGALRHFPLNWGALFSRKAPIPSF